MDNVEMKANTVINIVSNEYDIKLYTPVKTIKEAVDVSAYLMKKHTDLTNYAIARSLGRSTASEFATKSMHEVKDRMQSDVKFREKVTQLEIKVMYEILN